MERRLQGIYREQFADGTDKLHYGFYYITILKTRCKITFKPFGYEFPLFKDFIILGNFDKTVNYIERNWE